jgi:hypothetical protein
VSPLFHLAYRFEAVIPIELEIPSLRVAVEHNLGDVSSLEARLTLLEELDEDRRSALQRNEVMQVRRKVAHDKLRRCVEFHEGDAVMLLDDWLVKQKGQKFRPRWKGPFQVAEKYDNGSYKLSTMEGELIDRHVNGTKLKIYSIRA